MQKLVAYSTIAVLSVGMLAFAGGCQRKTESQRTQERANMMDSAADTIRRGEQEVADGKALIARGQALKSQGNTDGGEKLIAEGRALEKSGNARIAEGKRLRDIAD